MLRSLDLFSGIGGISHGLRGIASPLAYCEIDPFAVSILQSRMRDGSLPHAPICGMHGSTTNQFFYLTSGGLHAVDVVSLNSQWLQSEHCGGTTPMVDLIVAGFPCQGFDQNKTPMQRCGGDLHKPRVFSFDRLAAWVVDKDTSMLAPDCTNTSSG